MTCTHRGERGERCAGFAYHTDGLCPAHHALFRVYDRSAKPRVQSFGLAPEVSLSPCYAFVDVYLRERRPDERPHGHALFLPRLAEPHPEDTRDAWLLVHGLIKGGVSLRFVQSYGPDDLRARLVHHVIRGDFAAYVAELVPALDLAGGGARPQAVEGDAFVAPLARRVSIDV